MIALIGIVLLIGIVKKNAIMMIDFALDAERKEGMAPLDAIYQACLLRFRPIMMTTMAALLGGVPLALRHGHGIGTAAAAGHHDHRRPDLQPDADAVHHAGDLSLVRPAGAALLAHSTKRTGSEHDRQRMSTRTAAEPERVSRHEHLRAIHPQTGRHHAADCRASRWPGAAAFRLLPVSPLPQVDFPTISVNASLPGASPETMASSVATPLERQFGRIAARHRDDLVELLWVRPASRCNSI